MKTSIPAAIEAAKVAASVIELICRSPKFTSPGQPHQYRSPEQISLIVDMVNTAMDAVLSLNVGTVEAMAEMKTPDNQAEKPNIGAIVAEAIARNACDLRELIRRGNVQVIKVKAEDFANESQGN